MTFNTKHQVFTAVYNVLFSKFVTIPMSFLYNIREEPVRNVVTVSEFFQQLNFKALDQKLNACCFPEITHGWVVAIIFSLYCQCVGLSSRWHKAEVISNLLCWGILFLEKRWQNIQYIFQE